MRILVRLGHLYHLASVEPVARAFASRGHDLEFCCVEESERVFGFPISKRKKAERELSDRGYVIAKNFSGFDVVLTGDFLPDPENFSGSMLVLVNHGSGVKTTMYRLLAKWNHIRYLIMVEGPYRKRKLENSGNLGESAICMVGYPKLDPIFNGQIDGKGVIRKYSLDENKPTVLYAPSHKPSSIDIIGTSILSATRDYNLLIKLHPYSWGGKYAPHRHHRIYEKVIKDFPHARLVPPHDLDLLPFLCSANVLVTDVSSVMFEMLALGKFGVIFEVPQKDELDDDPKILFKDAWLTINNIADLRDAIVRSLEPTSEMLFNAEKLRLDLFYGLDGKASERIVDILESHITMRDLKYLPNSKI